MNGRDVGAAALVGLAGAGALFGVHQLARLVTDDAPRMDVIGRRAVEKGLRAFGAEPGDDRSLSWITFGSAIASDSAYYSLVGAGRRSNRWVRGALLGVTAGLGALLIPRRIGLGDPPKSDHVANQMMTIAWYVIGGVAAAATAAALDRRDQNARRYWLGTAGGTPSSLAACNGQ